jgi:nitrile hydratase subunit alpha
MRAVESLLIEKGMVSGEAIDAITNAYEHDIGPLRGAGVVARAWVDEDYRRRLLSDGPAAIAELGIRGFGAEVVVVVENTAHVHNVVVCTLCSCYPWSLLGLPPVWYKSAPYRSRVVNDPRSVLADFGVTLPETTRIRVWDSTAEVRHLVLPMRPDGTDGFSKDELANLVTRDSMIGTGLPLTPAAVQR